MEMGRFMSTAELRRSALGVLLELIQRQEMSKISTSETVAKHMAQHCKYSQRDDSTLFDSNALGTKNEKRKE